MRYVRIRVTPSPSFNTSNLRLIEIVDKSPGHTRCFVCSSIALEAVSEEYDGPTSL